MIAKQMINITLRSVVAASSGEDGENKGHQPENENYVNKPHPRDTRLKMRPCQNQMTCYLKCYQD
jgi:hypothetical protein